MLKEIINFTKNLDDKFKNLAYRPSPGLHILVRTNEDNFIEIDKYLYYNGTDELNDELLQIVEYERHSSYLSMNQQKKFDKKQKIHSTSPFSLAFNFSLGNKKKEITENIQEKIENDTQIKFSDKTLDAKQKLLLKTLLDNQVKAYKIETVKERLADYFSNAKQLCLAEVEDKLDRQIKALEDFCKVKLWEVLPKMKMKKNISKKKKEEEWVEVAILSELKEKNYVRVYISDVDTKIWKAAFNKYYLGEYPPSEYNTTDFISTYPAKKPFMSHKTAAFETFEISGTDANYLKQFKDILTSKPKIIPNPFPLFIYKDELQKDLISMFNNDRTLTYTEMIDDLWNNYKDDFKNYYLINWYAGKDIVFQDFDFVSQFEYEFEAHIKNLFEIQEKGGKKLIFYPKIANVFQLEKTVFIKLIGNKYHKVDYFKDLDNEDYKDRKKTPNLYLDYTFQSFAKYRKAVYDFVYKSKRQGIDGYVFYDMVFSRIKDDLKNNNTYSIKEKLNIWFSLYEKFNNPKNNEISMASKLKEYQNFVSNLAVGLVDIEVANDTYFAFAAGQVIEYVIQKSKSDNKSYQLLEPYLQQSKCSEFKKALANDIARYKHAIGANEIRFKNVCAFVQTWETDKNMKDLLPEILAGIFAKNEFFTIKLK